jgi:hypothetical protein
MLGELEIGRGALYWTGYEGRKSKRLSWSRFAEMMDDLACSNLRWRPPGAPQASGSE